MIRHCLAPEVLGFEMFWNWESGEILRQIDVETEKVGLFNSSLLVQSDTTLFFLSFLVWYWFVSNILPFDRDAYNAKVKKLRRSLMKVSRKRLLLKCQRGNSKLSSIA